MGRISRSTKKRTAVIRRDRFRCVFCGWKAEKVHHVFGNKFGKITSQIAVCDFCHRLADAHELPTRFTLKIPYFLLRNLVKAKLHALKHKKGKSLYYHLFRYWWK